MINYYSVGAAAIYILLVTSVTLSKHRTLAYVQFWGRVVYWHTIGRYFLRESCILTCYRILLSEGELYIDILWDVTFRGAVSHQLINMTYLYSSRFPCFPFLSYFFFYTFGFRSCCNDWSRCTMYLYPIILFQTLYTIDTCEEWTYMFCSQMNNEIFS